MTTSAVHATMNGVDRWGFDTPLVGREAELGRLIAALDRADLAAPTAVVIAGDAGVGKSRLVSDLLSLAEDRGSVALVGHCVDIGLGLPYLPFSEILRTIASDNPAAVSAVPAMTTLLSEGPDDRADSSASADVGNRLRLFEGVLTVLSEISAERTVVLVVEDLHWADESTRDLLRFLLTRLRDRRLLIIATYRSDDLHRRHPLRPWLAELTRLSTVDRLELPSLENRHISALIDSLAPDQVDPVALLTMTERAEGNAFYAEELLASYLDGEHRMSGIPDALADVLLTRVDRLQPSAQRVIRVAAVIARAVQDNILREVAALPQLEFDSALRELFGNHLMFSDDAGRYVFRHALLREAVYSDLLPGERVQLHAAAAGALRAMDFGPEFAAARAHHFRESNNLPEALRASIQAAEYAGVIGAPAEGLRHLESALELWSAVPDAPKIAEQNQVVTLLDAANAATLSGRPGRAIALTKQAQDELGPNADVHLTARVHYSLANGLHAVDEDRKAFELSALALQLIDKDPPSETRMYAAAAHLRSAAALDDYETADAAAHEALAAARVLGNLAAEADVLISQVVISEQGRDTAQGLQVLGRALDLAAQSGDHYLELRAYFNLAAGAYESGDMCATRNWVIEANTAAAKHGIAASQYAVGIQQFDLLAAWAMGDWDEVLTHALEFNASTTDGDLSGFQFAPAVARGEIGVNAEIKQFETDVRAYSTAHGSVPSHGAALAATASGIDYCFWSGDPDGAIDWLESRDALVRGLDSDSLVRLSALALGAVVDAAILAKQRGDLPALQRWTAEVARLTDVMTAQPVPTRWPSEGPEIRAWRARGLAEIARLAGPAVQLWQRAVSAFDYSEVYEQARCRWRLAEALLATGDDEAARVEIQLAHDVAVRLKAKPLAAVLDRLVRTHHLTISRSPGPTARVTGSILTARELDVMLRLADGDTNKQIGEALFISAKTASVHVSNILAKLKAASRAEAVSIAHRTGLL